MQGITFWGVVNLDNDFFFIKVNLDFLLKYRPVFYIK